MVISLRFVGFRGPEEYPPYENSNAPFHQQALTVHYRSPVIRRGV